MRGKVWIMAALFTLLGAGLLAAPGTPALAQNIVAVVNDGIVTDLQVDQRVRMALFASNQTYNAEAAERLRQPMLQTLIDERLQVQEARRLGIEISPAELEDALDDVARRNQVSRDQLRADLARAGVEERTLRDQLEAQLAWIQVSRRQLLRRVVVSDVQVDRTLDRIVAGERQYRLAEIFLPIYSPADEQRVLQDAERLGEATRRGADFAGIAEQFSASPSAARGGELGWIPVSSLPPELAGLVAQLADGEVSPPIRTPEGVYLFRRLGQRGGGTAGVVDEGTREQVMQRLREDAMERLSARYLRNLRQEAFIDLRL